MHRPFQNVESGGAILFDCLQAVCWFVNMNSNVTSSRVTNVSPGELYTFVFTQNAAGGHSINWPANCRNAPQINPAPTAITVQTFIGNPGGIMQANIPPAGRKP